MQSQHLAGLPGDVECGPAPELVPGRAVGCEQLVEAGCGLDSVDRGVQRIADRGVAGGVQSDGLVDGEGLAGRHVQAHSLDGAGRRVLGGDGHPGGQPGRQSDSDVGGAGAATQPHGVRGGGAGVHVDQVAAVQVAVTGHAGVDDSAVDCGLDLQLAGEALGRELGTQGGEMRVGHVHETKLVHGQGASVAEPVPGPALEQARGQVQDLVVVEHGRRVRGEPLPSGEAETQRQPVREVDHVLVLHPASGHVRGEPVVATRHIGARVVHIVRAAFGQRPAGGEVAVAQRAQGLPQTLVRGVIALVPPGPAGHCGVPATSSSPGSRTRSGRAYSWLCRSARTPRPERFTVHRPHPVSGTLVPQSGPAVLLSRRGRDGAGRTSVTHCGRGEW